MLLILRAQSCTGADGRHGAKRRRGLSARESLLVGYVELNLLLIENSTKKPNLSNRSILGSIYGVEDSKLLTCFSPAIRSPYIQHVIPRLLPNWVISALEALAKAPDNCTRDCLGKLRPFLVQSILWPGMLFRRTLDRTGGDVRHRADGRRQLGSGAKVNNIGESTTSRNHIQQAALNLLNCRGDCWLRSQTWVTGTFLSKSASGENESKICLFISYWIVLPGSLLHQVSRNSISYSWSITNLIHSAILLNANQRA